MAVYKISPVSGKVSGTNASMPLVLIPSLTIIGTLTTAQANSIRIYEDVNLTTEVARQVVSANEIHFKGTSVTSASEYWVDIDGIRADYAVTDTFGRNAVWSDYVGVFHLQGDSEDSTGTADGTDTSMTYNSSAGKIGEGGIFNGTSSRVNLGTGRGVTTGLTLSAWVKGTSTTNRMILSKTNGVGGTTDSWYLFRFNDAGTMRLQGFVRTGATNRYLNSVGGTVDVSGREFVAFTHDLTNSRLYVGGALNTTSATWTGALNTNASQVWIGLYGQVGLPPDFYWDGDIDEARICKFGRSANWITTEYNNQVDNGAFWNVTLTGFTPSPLMHMIQIAGTNV